MRYTVMTRVNIETAPHDADDTAAELTDSIHHWITDAYGRTDDHFKHNAVTVDSVKHAETQPRDEAEKVLRTVHAHIRDNEHDRQARLADAAIEAENTAYHYAYDELSADINEERAEDLARLREAVRVLLEVLA